MLKKLFPNISKTTLVIVALIVLLAIGGICYLAIKQQQSAKRLENLSKVTSSGQTVIIDTIRDKEGRQHAVTREVPVESESEKRLAVGGSYIDTVSTALKVAVDRIEELTKANGTLVARVKLLETIKEIPDKSGNSIAATLKVHQDKYLYAEYNPSNDSLFLDYKVALNTAKYSKRKSFLHQRENYINIWSDDPRVTINGVKRFSEDVTPKPKRFSIGPNVSYSYNFLTGKWQPAVGIGLQYNLIRF